MLGEGGDELLPLDVPELDRLVVGGGHDRLSAVGGGEVDGAHRAVVRLDARALAARGVGHPDADRLVPGARGQEAPAGGVVDPVHGLGVAGEPGREVVSNKLIINQK